MSGKSVRIVLALALLALTLSIRGLPPVVRPPMQSAPVLVQLEGTTSS